MFDRIINYGITITTHFHTYVSFVPATSSSSRAPFLSPVVVCLSWGVGSVSFRAGAEVHIAITRII